MSSTYLTSNDITMIERLLAEVRVAGTHHCADIETAQARLLIYAFEDGMSEESDLRRLLSGHVSLHNGLARSRQRWVREAGAPSHRQEHLLPSPEEEFNVAGSIHPMVEASPDGEPVIGRTAEGETALVHWWSGNATFDPRGQWVRLDTGEPFDAVHWVQTTWTAAEVLEHSSAGGPK